MPRAARGEPSPERPSRLTRAERKAATRSSLLDAAERLVKARGFHVSLDEIAAEAGLTKGAVYSNFEGRAELLLEVAERLLQPAVRFDDLPRSGALSDTLAHAALRMAHSVDEQPENLALHVALLAELLRDPELGRRAASGAGTSQYGDAKRLEERASRDGWALPRNAEELLLLLDSVSFALGVARALHGPSVVPDELFEWVFRRLADDGRATGPASGETDVH